MVTTILPRQCPSPIWFSAAVPITAAVPPAIVYGATQLWLDRRRAHRFARQNELLRRFQSPALRDWLTRNPNFLSEPVRQEAAIVFIRLSGVRHQAFERIVSRRETGFQRDFLRLSNCRDCSEEGECEEAHQRQMGFVAVERQTVKAPPCW